MARRWISRLAIVVAAVALIAAAFMLVIRPWYFNWGATAEEISLPLPGDDLVPQPAKAYTRAITIRAPAEDVWPWLAQFGQGEGGMYSYEWIEQMIGCDMHNADQVVAEWQTVSPGSEVRMCQEGYGPPPYLVAAVEPGRALIMGHHVEEGSEAWAESWAFVVSPVDAHTTRLLIRSRSMLADGFWAVIEPGVFVMEYGMMHGIKARAEALAGVAPETPWVRSPR